MDRREALQALTKAGKTAEVRKLVREAADAAQRGYTSIASDDGLSETGRNRRLAQEYQRAAGQVDSKLFEMAGRVYSTDLGDAEKVFGTKGIAGDAASLMISRRDAADRVAAVAGGEKLRNLLRRATRSGDEVLARAVAQQAVESLDDTTVNEFLSTRPDLDASMQRLWDAQRAESNTIGWTIEFFNLRPSELSRMSDEAIETLAESAEEVPATPLASQGASAHGMYWSGDGGSRVE